jgi:hypothetical protein
MDKKIKYSELTEEERQKRNEASKRNYRNNRYKRLAYQKEYNKIHRAKNVEYQHDYFKKKQISKYNKDYYINKITNNKEIGEKESTFTVTF